MIKSKLPKTSTIMKRKKKEDEVAGLSLIKKNQSNNKKKSIMNSGKIALSILASVGVGVLIGIVFAPQKGSKTRRKIITKGEDYLDDLKNQFNDFLNDATDKIEKIGQEKDDFLAKEKGKLIDIKNGIKSAIL
jgi:gas vesicle protein